MGRALRDKKGRPAGDVNVNRLDVVHGTTSLRSVLSGALMADDIEPRIP